MFKMSRMSSFLASTPLSTSSLWSSNPAVISHQSWMIRNNSFHTSMITHKALMMKNKASMLTPNALRMTHKASLITSKAPKVAHRRLVRCHEVCLTGQPSTHLHTAPPLRNRKTFEPDYLDDEANHIPTYPPLNIQIKGYNFDVLEELQSWIHKTAENMGIEVFDTWATPAQNLKVTTYHEGGTRPKEEYNLHLYERNVQIVNLRSVDAPTLIDIIQRALPEGVNMSLHEHTTEMAELRWIADPFIDQLRSELSQKAEEKELQRAEARKVAEAKEKRKRETLLKSLLE